MARLWLDVSDESVEHGVIECSQVMTPANLYRFAIVIHWLAILSGAHSNGSRLVCPQIWITSWRNRDSAEMLLEY